MKTEIIKKILKKTAELIVVGTISGVVFWGGWAVLYQPDVGVNHINSTINQSTESSKVQYDNRIRANFAALESYIRTGKSHISFKSPVDPDVFYIGEGNMSNTLRVNNFLKRKKL